MDVVNVEKRPCQSYRSRPYSKDELTPELQEIKEQCTDVTCMKDVPDEIIQKVLDIYANDISIDLYNIAASLGVHYSTLGQTLRSPKWGEMYRAAKTKRAAVTTSKALSVASEPYDMFKRGEEPSFAFIKSADLYAKYLAFVAQKTDPELQGGSTGGGQLYVNTVVKIRDLSGNAPHLEQQTVIDGRCEDVTDGND